MKQKVYITVFFLVSMVQVLAKEYHVSLTGSDSNKGSLEEPLRTINAAAQLALPGDTVTVHHGTYREWVNPLNGGRSNEERILYRVAESEKVELKGSELIKGWKKEKKATGVWKISLSNDLFCGLNPYIQKICGDWFRDQGREHHTGDVYLNDVSLYEVACKEDVINPDTIFSVRDPQGTQRVWCAVTDAENTTIYANFGEKAPNKETVEIAVRPTCFYPTRQGLNYITIRGFHVSQAATQWAAPTAEQIGMIATHWCKGWIIENNVIKNSRCNGITLGKERSTGHNLETTDSRIDGTLHYMEVIFNTLRHGWSKDYVGSHIVRNNVISDCEQTAICGSMGGAFSEIYGNHIYNIGVKRQFGGLEMAGIKLHGAIDTYIHNNQIHKCGYGIWLDWMAQGGRVSSNLLYDNTGEDLFLEVNHGPLMVDNNLFLSAKSLLDQTDGGAFVHNLFAGAINRRQDYRYTPYHLAHSTEVKGISTIANGDIRFYNNIFIGGKDKKATYGLSAYKGVKKVIYAEDNFFCNDAKPVEGKEQGVVSDLNPSLSVENRGDEVYLSLELDKNDLLILQAKSVVSSRLGKAALTGYAYEMADGTPIDINKDYFGNRQSVDSPVVGPFGQVTKGQSIKIW